MRSGNCASTYEWVGKTLWELLLSNNSLGNIKIENILGMRWDTKNIGPANIEKSWGCLILKYFENQNSKGCYSFTNFVDSHMPICWMFEKCEREQTHAQWNRDCWITFHRNSNLSKNVPASNSATLKNSAVESQRWKFCTSQILRFENVW